VFLVLLVVDGFIINPIVLSSDEPGVLQPFVFSLVLVSGISATLRDRRISVLAGVLVAVSLAMRWANHVHPSLALERTDTVSSLGSALVLTALILVGVFRPGTINMHRIQGAIAVYLLLAYAWAFAYKLVALGDPNAFSFPSSELARHQLLPRLTYFSTVTLTTVGYGDITPVSPVARSLASLEAFTGQLFPAILLARLVSLELIHRAQRAPAPDVPRALDSDAGTP
jgi:voltage-gated potassium channel Kch